MWKKLFTSSLGIFINTVITATAILSQTKPAKADFIICNRTGENVSVAFAFRDQERKTWNSQGWWNLAPSACQTVWNGPLAPYNRYWYYYGEGDRGSTWSGDYSFCTNNEKFAYYNADAACSVPGGLWRSFQEVDIGEYTDFTLNLTD